jgi:pimeloyl-ACP methyl ester carboxylesterase
MCWLAALLPDLVTAAAALALFAPHGAEGLDWFDDMTAADAYRLALTDPDTVRAGLDVAREEELAMTASSLAGLSAPFLSATDAAVLRGELAEYMIRTNHEALAPGSQGWWDDSYGLIRPWGFELADISVPVLLLHGRQDKFVPFAHGQWLAAHIPGVEARLLDDDGHPYAPGTPGQRGALLAKATALRRPDQTTGPASPDSGTPD